MADRPPSFGTENVEPGTRVITDGWSGYRGIDKVGYIKNGWQTGLPLPGSLLSCPPSRPAQGPGLRKSHRLSGAACSALGGSSVYLSESGFSDPGRGERGG